MKVLIVDDEIKVCNLIHDLVDWVSLGLEIVGFANDGKSAFEMTEQLSPEIVITDIRMPGYSGIELIQRVRETNQKMHFIIISGYQQFEYANQAIRFGVEDYLLKPLKQSELERILKKIVQQNTSEIDRRNHQAILAQQMEQSIKRLKEHFLQLLITPATWEEAHLTLACANEQYHCGFDDSAYQILLVQATMEQQVSDSEADYLLTQKLLNLCENELTMPTFHAVITSIIDGHIVCLLQGNEEQFAMLHSRLKKISYGITTLRDVFESMSVAGGMSARSVEFNKLPECMRQARMALMQNIFSSTNEITEYSDACEPDCSVEIILDGKFRVEFRKRVALLDDIAIADLISQIESRLRLRKSSGWLVSQVCNQLLELFVETMGENRVKMPDHFLKNSQDKLAVIHTFSGVFDALREYLRSSICQWKQTRLAEDTKPIRIAKQYIHDCYANPITLNSISDEVGLNASYFSSLFKKETGQNFIDYLSEVRIDVAKEFLVETDMSIGEIAEKVGYNDMKYFYKRFRQSTGISLKEYRKLYR